MAGCWAEVLSVLLLCCLVAVNELLGGEGWDARSALGCWAFGSGALGDEAWCLVVFDGWEELVRE